MTRDLGPLPVEHPRAGEVEKAAREIESLLLDVTVRYTLTRAEQLAIISDYVARRAADAVRKERDC
jgi:hypothetical protein